MDHSEIRVGGTAAISVAVSVATISVAGSVGEAILTVVVLAVAGDVNCYSLRLIVIHELEIGLRVPFRTQRYETKT